MDNENVEVDSKSDGETLEQFLENMESVYETKIEEIKRELVKAKEEIKAQIIDLAIGAAKTVITEKLTEDDDRKIVEDFLKGVDDAK